jgi:programmed cell death protein 5
MRKRVAEAIRAAQLEQQKKEILRRFLDGAAYDRIMNVRVSNPELYEQLVGMVVSLVQSNRIQGKLTEAQLRSLIERLTFKRETTISFKHK